jgi:hypothetical protein
LGVPTHFFRVDGADQQTGEETYLVLQADSKPHAEKIARKQGLLISSVRVARASDWDSTPPSAALDNGEADLPRNAAPSAGEVLPISDAAPPLSFVESSVVAPVSQAIAAPPPVAAEKAEAATGSAAAVVLGCVGGALVVGGVLALVLALWPDNAVRNELQQLDFRLNQLNQTIIGSMLVLGGLMVFVLTAQIRTGRR